MYRTLFSTHLMIKSVLEISTVEAIILGKFKVAKVTTVIQKYCLLKMNGISKMNLLTDANGQLSGSYFLQVPFIAALYLATFIFSIGFRIFSTCNLSRSL